MGTRSLTVIRNAAQEEIAVLYRQYDGYPEGHGNELKEFVKDKTVVNGIRHFDTKNNAFNGPYCMAASIVAFFKDDIGGFYLHPAGTRGIGEEYIYYVYPKNGKVKVEVNEA